MLHTFKEDISSIPLPEKFTFPFYYDVHPLAKIATEALQHYLETQQDFEHNFGLQPNQEGLVIGKMFGVLVYKNQVGELGYLWAFSGKMAGINLFENFVPPLFDMLKDDGFYRKEEKVISQINVDIEAIETSEAYKAVLALQRQYDAQFGVDVETQKQVINHNKNERLKRKEKSDGLSEIEKEDLIKALGEESKNEKILLKQINQYWAYKFAEVEQKLRPFETQLDHLRTERKTKSAALQQQLFDAYTFLNIHQERKSIGQLFDNNPPAGAGECAAPKLLHFAFANQLTPVCMAEFWWGQSPKSEVRKHKEFYPACNSKCKPILMQHMLIGLTIDDNLLLENPAEGKNIDVIYEDAHLAVIYKPHDFLSVPGKDVSDSVLERAKKLFPTATGPLIVHRLDMATSGLMIIPKNETVYVAIQRQFTDRSVKKRYTALLSGVVKTPKGTIELPLRVDLDDRPRQLVCHEHGKNALTAYEVVSIKKRLTKIYFYPHTGRTHQLRVHAAHELGLGTPIVGDDLYGSKADRLYLQAAYISFFHPVLGKMMEFEIEDEF